MHTIQTKDSDGSVVLFGNPACPPVDRVGYTIHAVNAIPPGPATLRWQDGALVRVVAPPTPQQTFAAAVAAGYTVPGVTPPLVLDLSDEAQGKFTSLLVLLDKLLAVSALTAASQQTIADKNGQPHVFTVAQIQGILLGYGVYYAGLFNALHAAAASPTS